MAPPLTPRDLLLARDLAPGDVHALLAPFGFADTARADTNLQEIASTPRARTLLAGFLRELLGDLSDSADPDQALDLLERFARAAVNPVGLLWYLEQSPRSRAILARAFGVSPFMAEILIRDPGLLHWIADPDVLDTRRTAANVTGDLADMLGTLKTDERRADALRIAKRREVLHVGVRDILRRASVDATLEALTSVADGLISAACALAARVVDGPPEPSSPETLLAQPEGLAVIALGKLGAGELNFSSDVDLLYVVSTEEQVPRGERLAKTLTSLLSSQTAEGSVYRVDLRLRPEGRVGSLVTPLPAAVEYYRDRGATWERLALLRARPVAGEAALGNAFIEAVQGFVFGHGLDAQGLDDIRRMKSQVDARTAARDTTSSDVKLGAGGIRELELIAQTLQVTHGHDHPALHQRATVPAIDALGDGGFLSPEQRQALTAAYRFLRDVENRLQMVHDVQQHTIPRDEAALRRLARSLGYVEGASHTASEALLADLDRHRAHVRTIFLATMGAAHTP